MQVSQGPLGQAEGGRRVGAEGGLEFIQRRPARHLRVATFPDVSHPDVRVGHIVQPVQLNRWTDAVQNREVDWYKRHVPRTAAPCTTRRPWSRENPSHATARAWAGRVLPLPQQPAAPEPVLVVLELLLELALVRVRVPAQLAVRQSERESVFLDSE